MRYADILKSRGNQQETAPKVGNGEALPDLPEPEAKRIFSRRDEAIEAGVRSLPPKITLLFTADQMREYARAAIAFSTQAEVQKPFMYGIQEPNGSPYFDELCVSGDEEDLEHVVESLNDNDDDGKYKVVALYISRSQGGEL